MERRDTYGNFLIKSDETKNTIISGYASVFGVVDSQNDVIEKGAFKEAKSENVKLLWQHDKAKPIGVIKSIYEDDYGLKIEAEINNKTTYGNEAAELIKQKAVNGLSIGFYAKDFEYTDQGFRLLTKLELMEVSIVTFPANNSANITDVKAMSRATTYDSLQRLERVIGKLINFNMRGYE